MFYVAVWKLSYKLMRNNLPAYFSTMRPTLPTVCSRYKIITPVFHRPYIRHTFAEHSVRFCLINLFLRRRFILHRKKKIYKKKYIDTLQNLYTHTINIEHIIYMQEYSGLPHFDQYRSKLYSLYTSNDRL